jgi:hypothetical protein
MAKQSIPRTEEDVLGPLMLRLIGTTAALVAPLLWFTASFRIIPLVLVGQLVVLPIWAVVGHRTGVARRLFLLLVVALSVIYLCERIFRDRPASTPSGRMLVALLFLIVVPAAIRILGYAGSRQSHDATCAEKTFQLSIRQIFGLTTLAAIALAVAQSEIARPFRQGLDPWFFLFAFPGIAAWAVLGVAPLGAVGILLVVLGLAIGFSMPAHAVLPMVYYAMSVVAPLFVFRSVGFRLARIKIPPARIKPQQSIAAIDSYFTEHDHP